MILNQDKYFAKAKSSERFERKISLKKGQIHFFKPTLYQSGFKKIYENRIVNSIYFDDEDFSLVRENIDGVSSRIKLRIRFYENDYSNAKLEMKFKSGQLGRKYYIDMNKTILTKTQLIEDACQILNNISINNLYPTSHVKYQREYLINSENIRCTVDTNINSVRLNNYTYYAHADGFYDVCEFKYLPELDKNFREEFVKFKRFSVRATKSSKYLKSIIING
tara:strand:- start:1032 stop:1697 length:666 start_codon:yes stop_codon:yes gene_type:complete